MERIPGTDDVDVLSKMNPQNRREDISVKADRPVFPERDDGRLAEVSVERLDELLGGKGSETGRQRPSLGFIHLVDRVPVDGVELPAVGKPQHLLPIFIKNPIEPFLEDLAVQPLGTCSLMMIAS